MDRQMLPDWAIRYNEEKPPDTQAQPKRKNLFAAGCGEVGVSGGEFPAPLSAVGSTWASFAADGTGDVPSATSGELSDALDVVASVISPAPDADEPSGASRALSLLACPVELLSSIGEAPAAAVCAAD